MRTLRVASLPILLLLACTAEPEAPRPLEPVDIRLDPASLEVTVETSVRLGAQALDRHGRPILEAELRFDSADPAIASVDAQGWVRGEAPGATEILVRAGKVESSLPVHVRHKVHEVEIRPPAPQLLEDDVLKLDFALYDRWGNPIEAGLEPRWRSEDPQIARVDEEGWLEALAPGEARIRVAVGEGEGETTVEVSPRAQIVEIQGTFRELVAGEEMALRATVLDRRGRPLARDLRWSSSDEALARVSERGRVQAVAPGEVVIRAEVDEAVGEFALRVLPRVAVLELRPTLTRLYVGGTTDWSALAFDAGGNRLEGRRIHWSSSAPEVAEVNQFTGRIEGRGAGTATIIARSGQARAEATVEVFPAVDLVVRIPPPPRLEPGFSAPVEAEIVGEPAIPYEWGSSDPAVAWVEGGAVRVNGLGEAVLQVEAGGLRQEFAIRGSLRFQSVKAGGDFACGLTEEHRVWCWGNNAYGQLGDGSREASWIPVRTALDLAERYVAITAGTHHACALTEEGRAFCWGDDRSGALGAETEGEASPLPVPSVAGERFVSLSAGDIPFDEPLPEEGAHTCGLTLDGRALCWGNGRQGQLGHGATPEASPPVSPSGGHVFVKLEASAGYTCGLTEDESLYCWGKGPLGTPPSYAYKAVPLESTTPRIALVGPPDAPPGFPPVPEAFRNLVLGQRHACATDSSGLTYCWGNDIAFALSTSGYTIDHYGAIVFRKVGLPYDLPIYFSELMALGSTISCGVDPQGSLLCWGRALDRYDSVTPCEEPKNDWAQPIELGFDLVDLAIGRRFCEDFLCVLDEEGLARCWGANPHGQVGRPPGEEVREPTPLFPDGGGGVNP